MDEEDQKDIIRKVKTSGAEKDDDSLEKDVDAEIDKEEDEVSGEPEEGGFGDEEEELEEGGRFNQDYSDDYDKAKKYADWAEKEYDDYRVSQDFSDETDRERGGEKEMLRHLDLDEDVMGGAFYAVDYMDAVSYTHLTLPTKRIV